MSSPVRPPGSALRAAAVGVAVAAGGALLIGLSWCVDRRWTDIHMTEHYCAEYPAELARGTVLRWTGIVLGVLMLALSRHAARWAARHSGRQVLGAVLRISVAAVLALFASDAVLRLRDKGRVVPSVFHYEPDSQVDPLLVYRPIPSHVTEVDAGDRHLRFVVDANDWRVRSTDDVVDFARPTVLFTGESMGSGFGLNYEETYPFRVGQSLGLQVVNVAVQGYGNDGAYVRLHDALPRFEHPVATVTLVNQMMTERNVWPDRPHLLLGDDGSARTEPVRNMDGWFARSPLWRFASSVVHSDEALRRARTYIAATAGETRRRGGFPLFLVTDFRVACLPDETGAPSLERYLFEGMDVAHVRVDLGEETYDPIIKHPNAAAQEKLAEAVTRALREHGVGEGAESGRR
ncbi:MAG TPA: hypothetical protein VGL81_15850 [Polyangiaceae bacterium]|jgi:hypothetical protein